MDLICAADADKGGDQRHEIGGLLYITVSE